MTFDSLRAGKVREPQYLGSFVLGTCRRVVADLRRGDNSSNASAPSWSRRPRPRYRPSISIG